MMCSSNNKTCIVHSENIERSTWSYYNTGEEIELLINSLNPFGIREKPLLDNLQSEKELIIDHISNCPDSKLNVIGQDKKEILDLMVQNMKKYERSMMNFPIETDINEILELTLRDYILELDDKVTTGFFGIMKVTDKAKWRNALEERGYDMQSTDLAYGLTHILATETSPETQSPDTPEKNYFADPGSYLGNTLDVESEDSSDENVLIYNSPERQKIINTLACALLQIKQSIDSKYLKYPFAPNSKIKGGNDNALIEKNLLNWEASLMNASNYSQIFLHYNVLHDSIKWSQSANRAYCRLCRRKHDPDKMLLCDGCNRGHHMYCLKPKLKKIPTGDWFCDKCIPKTTPSANTRKKRKIFSEDTDEEEAEDEEDEEEDENEFENSIESIISDGSDSDKDICIVCKFEGELAKCSTCSLMCHFECAKPVLVIPPKSNWICWKCKQKKTKRKIEIPKAIVENGRSKRTRKTYEEVEENDDEDDDEEEEEEEDDEQYEDDENVRRSSRTNKKSGNLRRSSRKLNGTIEDEDSGTKRSSRHKEDNDTIKRKSRRSYEDNNLPLHNVLLYSLLEEIGKNDDSWPFSRPVQKHEVPDYYDIIKVPMDFAKIKSRLNLGYYKSDYDIMNDIQLVFTNCDLYNSSESAIYQAGIRLEKFLEKKCKQLNLPFRPSDMIASDDLNGVSSKKKKKIVN